MAQRTGQCLCGAVTFTADVGDGVLACHCTQCQRWTGGGPYLCVSVSDLAPRRWNILNTARLVPMEWPDSTVTMLPIRPWE